MVYLERLEEKVLGHLYLLLCKNLIHILSLYNLNIKKEHMMLLWSVGQTEPEGNHLGREDPGQGSRTWEQYVLVYTDSQNM